MMELSSYKRLELDPVGYEKAIECWDCAVGVVAWLATLTLLGLLHYPWPVATTLSVVYLGFIGTRLHQSLEIWAHRAQLGGFGPTLMTLDDIDVMQRKRMMTGREVTQIWFGIGFEWHREETQKLYNLSRENYASLLLPNWLRKLYIEAPPLTEHDVGLPIIHAVGFQDQPIIRQLKSMGGGTLIVGTTQSGKGVMLTNLISQAILRGDVVIVIDPKSSKRLRQTMIDATRRAGRGQLLEFHPGFPNRGIRLDPLGSFSRPSELATRITSIIPEGNGAFTAFAWQAVNVAVQGLLYNGIRPNLLRLAQVLRTGVGPLLKQSVTKALLEAHVDPQWVLAHHHPQVNLRLMPDVDPEILQLTDYWQAEIEPIYPNVVIESLLQTWRHNKDHYAKITATLQPVLSMLTSGHLGSSLSPDPEDASDTRPIMTLERMIGAGQVLYLGLDALPDATVASAIGSILLADLTALAGKRYNEERSGQEAKRISLFVDETANVINTPLIELLNKGLEAGVEVTAAMQTISDLTARLGSDAKARMALGNFNNLLVLRTKDQATQRFVAEAFGRTTIFTRDQSVNSSRSDNVLDDVHLTITERHSGHDEPLIPIDMLGKLPNMEFFASLSGGHLYKGRVPILDTKTQGLKLVNNKGQLRPHKWLFRHFHRKHA